MSNVHLEMAQLWRCPVEWCAVWKGSVRACQDHLSKKHGGSSLFGLKNVAKPSPHGLFPATFGRRLFGPMFRVLLWTPVSSMRPDVDWCTVTGCIRTHSHTRRSRGGGGVIPRLLSCVSRAMAIARLTHLRISVPDDVTMLGEVSPSVCSLVLKELTP